MPGQFGYLRGMAIALILFIERINLSVLPFPVEVETEQAGAEFSLTPYWPDFFVHFYFSSSTNQKTSQQIQ